MEWEPSKCLIPQRLQKIGKTQRWLSDKVGDSEQQVSHYITMHRLLGLKKAKMYASVLNCYIDELYEWRDVEIRQGE